MARKRIAEDPERVWQLILDTTERTQTLPLPGSLAEQRGLGVCWMWTGKLWKPGYFGLGSEYGYVVIYRLFVGPITPGLQIDHLCERRECANPEHYEQVTGAENTRRNKLGRSQTWDHRNNRNGWTRLGGYPKRTPDPESSPLT